MGSLYMSLNKKELERLEKVSDITEIDYEIKDSAIPVDSLNCAIQDLLCAYNRLKEKYEDLKQNVEDNYEYKKLNPYKEYGVNEHDFH